MKQPVKEPGAAEAFVIVPFGTIDDARDFAASVESSVGGAIVTPGSRQPWSEEDQSGSELTLEGWRVKVASGSTVVMTDRLRQHC